MMTANQIVDTLTDYFDEFRIDRVASVWSSSDEILVEIEGTNFYIQHEPNDGLFNLLEVRSYGGSHFVQETQDWVVIASSDELVDVFKAYIAEELVQFSAESLIEQTIEGLEHSYTL